MTGNLLKKIRERHLFLSQQALAIELGLAVSSVARWEQLKDEEIPNSKMLELALYTISYLQDNPKTQKSYEKVLEHWKTN